MHRMMMTDKSATKGVHLTPGLVRRVWEFAHAYRARVAGFLVIVIVLGCPGPVPGRGRARPATGVTGCFAS